MLNPENKRSKKARILSGLLILAKVLACILMVELVVGAANTTAIMQDRKDEITRFQIRVFGSQIEVNFSEKKTDKSKTIQ
uniref:Uncharacterized protein n=2 Tax=Pseudoalteromonas rubra TaxID=43658 RepID=A0A0F4QIH5_9GAMM|nr:hypothetical protein TW77_16475 [Pseudoalteromonas rubra]